MEIESGLSDNRKRPRSLRAYCAPVLTQLISRPPDDHWEEVLRSLFGRRANGSSERLSKRSTVAEPSVLAPSA